MRRTSGARLPGVVVGRYPQTVDKLCGTVLTLGGTHVRAQWHKRPWAPILTTWGIQVAPTLWIIAQSESDLVDGHVTSAQAHIMTTQSTGHGVYPQVVHHFPRLIPRFIHTNICSYPGGYDHVHPFPQAYPQATRTRTRVHTYTHARAYTHARTHARSTHYSRDVGKTFPESKRCDERHS